ERPGLIGLRALGARLRRIELERRDAHRLPGLQPGFRLRPLAVHAQLALADDALDVTERQAGIAGLEETVDAHARLVARHGDGLHAARRVRPGLAHAILGSAFASGTASSNECSSRSSG